MMNQVKKMKMIMKMSKIQTKKKKKMVTMMMMKRKKKKKKKKNKLIQRKAFDLKNCKIILINSN